MGSWVRIGIVAAAVAFGGSSSPVLQAQDAMPKGDPARGHDLGNTCLGCHGVPGYKNGYPNYSVPKLEGQHADYLVSALRAYRSGERAHTTMHAQASSLSDQDIADVAAYFAGEPLKPTGKAPTSAPEAAAICVTCHGSDGVGLTPAYPTLAGQHEDYLARALLDYKKGTRKNPIMAGFAGQLSAEQIEELAAYYAGQQPALRTLNRPYTRLTSER